MGNFKSVRAKENIECDKCKQLIGDGDMYLFNEEENIKLCHFCNYKMQKEKKNVNVGNNEKPKAPGDFKKAVSKLDKLIEDKLGKKEE